ncbi:Propionate-CoA ligase [Fasciolopsis buskii]|uniref:Acyl-CoA synthetase short-chain family member 3, mitochondrial n=1 Tax=Fasciolopsis buskii TaxID=27845 RepID=A0A8E0VGA3_9TREM|nr:Propionate-CoA ligase [Fasciolopsis buski]
MLSRTCRLHTFHKFIRTFQKFQLSSATEETYKEAYQKSLTNPSEFWAEKAEQLSWVKKWDKVCENPNSPFPNWFQGGQINVCYNCLDRHVENGFGDQIAAVQDSPVTGSRSQYTYETLLNQVSHLAGYLARDCGIKKGDRILIYMPMIVECMITMLAAVRIGALHTVVFGGFSPDQLAVRIKNAKPRVIVTASYGVEPSRRVAYKQAVDEALEKSSCRDVVQRCIFFHRPMLPRVSIDDTKFFVDWGQAMALGRPHDAVPVEATHPLYLIYTSGTTGDPKGIVRDSGGYAVALKYTADKIYDIQPGDTWWASSEFGWVVGHSYCCYAPLLQRATTIIYEGKPIGTPDAAQFFRVLSENKVRGWFLTPSAARAIRSKDPDLDESERYRIGKPGLRTLANVFVAGEHCDESTMRWLARTLPAHVRISDTWWQTETGWPMTSSCLGYHDGCANTQGVVAPIGSAGLAVPGYNMQLKKHIGGNTSSQSLDVPPNKQDDQNSDKSLYRIVVKLPMPPGTALTLWNDDRRFGELYFKTYPGYYDTMDLGYRDANGYFYILSRADDVINVSGHRLSTSALEEACLAVDSIVDCAVIGVPHDVKGHIPFGVLVKNPHTTLSDDEILKATFKSVRELVGPVAAFSKACIVPKLPKTRSGKISRGSLAEMASGMPVRVPITIEDATVYEPIFEEFKKAGLKPSQPPTQTLGSAN